MILVLMYAQVRLKKAWLKLKHFKKNKLKQSFLLQSRAS